MRLFFLTFFVTSVAGIVAVSIGSKSKTQINLQPIAFSHKTHVKINKIDCFYCHTYAKRAKIAGVPEMSVCMGCHKIVSGTTEKQKNEIQKIVSLFNEGKTVEWLKIYNLQDFVYFSHKRHILKEVDCKECHGQVDEMEEIEKVSSLEMGWCLSCHRQRNASTDCITCHK